MSPLCDGMLRRIPSFNVLVEQSEAEAPQARRLFGGSPRGRSLADRLRTRSTPQPPAGKALLRVQQPSRLDVAEAGGPLLYQYGQACSTNDLLALEPGTYNLAVQVADDELGPRMLLTVTLQAGKIYTLRLADPAR